MKEEEEEKGKEDAKRSEEEEEEQWVWREQGKEGALEIPEEDTRGME